LGHFDIFDIRQKCDREDGACVGDVDYVRRYLSKKKKRTSLGIAPGSVFDTSDGSQSGTMLVPQFHIEGTDHTVSIAELLRHGIQVLVFAGDASYVSNYKGLLDTVKGMKWSGAAEFNSEPDHVWINGQNKPLGEVRTAQNLTFVRIYGAGHWVSY
jgi:cathepsin A (carboxypeptidase C)